jgi:hypothetical protein
VIGLWLGSLVLLAVAVGAFYFLGAYPMWLRLVVALCIWPVPPVVVTAWVIAVGDQAAPDARTVTPSELKR